MNERDIFLAAFEIADPVERAAYLDHACTGNAELRTQVEELLKTHAETSQFLETPAVGASSSVERTLMTDSAETDDDPTERASGEAEFRKYLEPATRPGWLGRLAHYEIEEILGRGAFGIVAKAFDEKLHRVVAIKLMSPELATTSPPRKRFLREARTAAAVTHENIVAIHAVEEEPIPYLVMEYIPGKTLQQRMEQHGPFEAHEVLRIGWQVAAGLAAAHAAHLIHRDIKPSNILLADSPNLRAKISDFGLARAVDDATLTSSGLIAGTPMYMAPEQARGETLDHRADLFSLGSVMYQMACGRPPFRAANTVAVLKRVCEDTPRPLGDVLPGTPDWLETIIFKLLEKERDDRFQTAQEVADLLARCQSELQHNGQVTCVERRSGTADTEILPAQKLRVSGAKKKPFGWLVGGVLAVVAVIGFVVMNSGKETPDPNVTSASGNTTSGSTTKTPADPTTTTGWHGWPIDAPAPAIAPFDAEQAKKHQEAWAKYLGVPVEYENSIGMKFRLIPPGEFLMGSTPEEIEAALQVAGEDESWRKRINREGPQQKVVLTQPIYVGVTEVTQSQYEQVIGTNPSHFSATGEGKDKVANLETGNHPVETVSRNDAVDFCAKLSQQEKLKPFYFRSGETVTLLAGTGYRLPTEAEWEYVCRAGTTTRFWSGDRDEDLKLAGWFGDNSGGRTHTVGALMANSFGLSDVHGNVWEWVQNSWDPAFYENFETDAAIDPYRPLSTVWGPVCGGNWLHPLSDCRSSSKISHPPQYRHYHLGFRVVLLVDAVKQLLNEKSAPPVTEQRSMWHGWPADAPAPAIAPFDAGQAKKHQEEWAKYLGVPVEYENSIGMKFRLIPPGEFLMGKTPSEVEAGVRSAGEDVSWRERAQAEGPQHKVILTQPIYVSTTEVTQSQYEQVMASNPAYFSAGQEGGDLVADLDCGKLPVEMVSWHDAGKFCDRLSLRNQLTPFYTQPDNGSASIHGSGYRLPTEAEWEWACRAGTTTRFWPGNSAEELSATAWFNSNSAAHTHYVGELKPNPFGLADMHGNVWEWVQDTWDPTFYASFSGSSAIDPIHSPEAGLPQVIRGGNWNNNYDSCHVAHRTFHQPTDRHGNIGFRVVLSVDAVQRQLAKKPETNSWHGWPADAPAPAIAPFDAEQAKKHQEEWAAYLKVPVEYTNSIGMKFRLIPPGEFLMGSTPEEIEAALPIAGDDQTWQDCIRSEGPRHKVILTQPFYLGTSEVTQSQFQRIMETNPSLFSQGGEWADSVQSLDTANFPVETVEWEAAREFCQQLVRREGLQPAATTTNGIRFPFGPDPYRLPSEAEWEFACRAGSTTQFSTGENSADLTKIGWFDDNSMERTHQTGELPANGFGLHDMHGNVWEWVLDDWLSDSYTARAEQPTINPIGPQTKNSEHMTRGGNWVSYAEACRSASRSSASSAYDSSLIGFRVAMSVDAVRDLMRRESDKNNTPLSSNNPDQKLAEWVIAQGGSVTLSVSDDSQTRVLRNLKSIDELPKQPFVVGDIFLIGLSSIDDDAVNTLRGLCPQGSLYVLELRDTSISDRAVERLAGMSIKYLGMSETRITDKCVQALPLIRDLSQLHLGGTRISDPACATLSEMKNIEFLGLGGTRITAEGVKQISRLPALSRLEIMSNPQIDDDALKALAEHPTLRTLLVTSTSVTDVGVSALKNPRLEHIELANNSQITPAGLSALSHLVSLRGFNLDNVPTAVTDERISVLSQLPRLTYLQVSKTSLTDLCIPELSRLRNLQLLNINSTKITANGVARLSEALPQCQIHWDGGVIKPHGTESDRKVAEWILGQGGQVEIEYEGRPQILVAGDPIPDSPFLIKTIATITAQMTPEFLHELGQLRGIYKINAVNSRLNDGDTEVIAKLSLLNHLNLHNTEIGDAGLEALSALPQVGFLGIAETNVTADGLKHLKNLISLESVAISPYQLTPVSIQYLNALPRLTTLGLGSAADSDLELLQQLSQVKVLDLNYGSTKLTKTGIENLHRAMPHCRIEWDGGIVEPLQTSDTGWHGWPVDAPAPAIAPFDANQAKAHQEAWAKYLGVPVEYENSLGMKFRLIPPGEFLMGSTPEEIEAALKVAGEDEGWRERINSAAPQHKVVLTQPVYVGVTEVTQTQYEQVMGSNPSHFSATGEGKDAVANLETGNHPVEMVGWNDAAEFCAKLSQQEQLKPFYFRSGETVTPLEGTGYRLPTEAEWESACRAGTTTRFWSGDPDQDLVSAGWFDKNSGGRPHAADELKANPFGLSDVHGNVWEWVQDSWDPAFYGKFEEDAAINPSSPFFAGSQRVLRGGNWLLNPSYCRSSTRLANHPGGRNYFIGFRVVLPVDAVIAALKAQVR